MGINWRQFHHDVLDRRRCANCFGKIDGRLKVEIVPAEERADGVYRHKDFGDCFRFAAARARTIQGRTRRAKRRWRKRHL